MTSVIEVKACVASVQPKSPCGQDFHANLYRVKYVSARNGGWPPWGSSGCAPAQLGRHALEVSANGPSHTVGQPEDRADPLALTSKACRPNCAGAHPELPQGGQPPLRVGTPTALALVSLQPFLLFFARREFQSGFCVLSRHKLCVTEDSKEASPQQIHSPRAARPRLNGLTACTLSYSVLLTDSQRCGLAARLSENRGLLKRPFKKNLSSWHSLREAG